MHIFTKLDPLYTFDNFTIEECNRFAYKAALEVAEGRGKNYFPLYIHGESGVGKTHLLHSIGNHALTLNESLKVVYLTSNDFIKELIQSLIDNHNTTFTERFRVVDMLLLDDVHHFSGKTHAQEHLFHIHDALLYSGKMLVVASNLLPMQIPQVEDRIITCLSGGVIAQIL